MAARSRTIAALTGGAVLVPVVSFGIAAYAAGEATPSPAQSPEPFCQGVPESDQPFTDISSNTFERTIECLAAADITRGGPGTLRDDQYGPGLDVTRDAMASFVVRMIDKADELDTGDSIRALPPYDGGVGFSDVSGVHAQAIDRLAEAGIVEGGPAGRSPDRYGPGLGVSRAQMASFVDGALEYMTGDVFETTDDYFTDDEDAAPHEPNIDVVAAEGIAVGDGVDTYTPFVTVRRDQMSGFLVRTLAVLAADGDIRPLD